MQLDEDCDAMKRKMHVVNASGYSFPCDIWSWGVLLCELIGGYNPFSNDTKNVTEIFDKILNGRISWPKNIN